MTEVKKPYQFCKIIAEDYNIELTQKQITKQEDFPTNTNTGKKRINSPYDAIIVDKSGNEFPYMLEVSTGTRNEEKLVEFDYIYVTRKKSLKQIIDETGVKLNIEPYKICEGNGWYTRGHRYSYKNIYCEF